MEMWNSLVRKYKPQRILKVSIVLHNLIPATAIKPELFEHQSGMPNQQMKRYESLSRAMDAVNARYGRDSIVMGALPKQSHSFSGTKIAFTRIPDKQEFHE